MITSHIRQNGKLNKNVREIKLHKTYINDDEIIFRSSVAIHYMRTR